MRKLVYSALAFSAAMAVGFGVQAADASAADAPVYINTGSAGDSMILKSTGRASGQLSVGIAKARKDGTLNVSAWDTYTLSSNVTNVDLSKINKSKDAILLVKDENALDSAATPILVKASDTIKVKYDKTKAEFSVTKKDGSAYSGNLQYRTENSIKTTITVSGGKFNKTELTDLEKYQMSGATLFFSIPDEKNASELKALGTVSCSSWKSEEALLYPQRGSKEVKVTVGKLANAPKVKVNYAKGTITVPKGVKYRRLDVTALGTAAARTAWDVDKAVDKPVEITLDTATSAAGAEKVTINAYDATKNFAIDVMTPGESGKKLDSRTGHYVYAPMATIAPFEKNESGKRGIAEIVKPSVVTDQKKGTLTVTLENEDKDHGYTVTYKKEDKDVTAKVNAGKTSALKGIDPYTDIQIKRDGVTKAGSEEWATNTVTLWTKAMVVPALNITSSGTVSNIKVTPNTEPKKTIEGIKDSQEYKSDNSTLKNAFASPGDVVEITCSADSSVVVKGADKKEIKKGDTDSSKKITFTMPSQGVTIEAEKKETT